ncbi:hypothetical protein N7462_003091 [Penicillium macrosclerotiorum]|uniref:uncharacterized protein n=1 Tax=Penicillium macrosclerotiorum TaxID=303699 RepID=UPI002548CEFF|nr:uncharacterized protein N7462_003091 [Penicillium macrosclerotiorum]KAJ5688699.1 hypothetical protein N7462_003091 [Penicillium macrosclerotiorum]
MLSQPSRSNSLPLFSATSPSSSRPFTPLSFSSKRPSERAVSPASSAGSHVSGVSHPPGSRKRRRSTIVTDVSSGDLLSSIDKWDDGHSHFDFFSSDPSWLSPLPSNSDRRTSHHARGRSPGDVPSELSIPTPSVSKVGRLYICDCCPKKPKKFDNPDDLRSHEMEKQYSCRYCKNRFKNKNEAERHENSMHLRHYSWSCAALPSFQAAFHSSASLCCQTKAGPSHDSCGYCGEKFPNFPHPDWDRRFEHLTTVHRFGECSNAKKFFRADHFRQHLKHSHAGSSGKWTNSMENACMKDEEPSKPRNVSRSVPGLQGQGSLDRNQVA